MFMDKATAHAERIEHARCFAEIHAVNKLPKHVTVDVEDGKSIDIAVEYESVPPICSKCSPALIMWMQVWQQKD